jgi:hypothetical protein
MRGAHRAMSRPPDARTPRAPFRAHRGVAGGRAPLESAPTSRIVTPRGPLTGSDRLRSRPSASLRRSFGVMPVLPKGTSGLTGSPSRHPEVGARIARPVDLSASRPACTVPLHRSARSAPAVTAASDPATRLSTGLRGVASAPEGASDGHPAPVATGSGRSRSSRTLHLRPRGLSAPPATWRGAAVPFPPGRETVRASTGPVQRGSGSHRNHTGCPQDVRRIRTLAAPVMREAHCRRAAGRAQRTR